MSAGGSGASEQFRATMRRFPAAVSVITVQTPDGPHGMTASSLTSISLEPPTVLLSLQRGSRTHELLKTGTSFAVNLLTEQQHGIARTFASKPGPEAFASPEWETPPGSGPAILATAAASLVCEVGERFEAGDHTLVLARVSGAGAGTDSTGPLVHYDQQFLGVAR